MQKELEAVLDAKSKVETFLKSLQDQNIVLEAQAQDTTVKHKIYMI